MTFKNKPLIIPVIKWKELHLEIDAYKNEIRKQEEVIQELLEDRDCETFNLKLLNLKRKLSSSNQDLSHIKKRLESSRGVDWTIKLLNTKRAPGGIREYLKELRSK